jgi:hypothetical protein
MNKNDRVKRIREMLTKLSLEQENGGFNEYSQFCEEALHGCIPCLTVSGQKRLMEEIEDTSMLGITRKNPEIKLEASHG